MDYNNLLKRIDDVHTSYYSSIFAQLMLNERLISDLNNEDEIHSYLFNTERCKIEITRKVIHEGIHKVMQSDKITYKEASDKLFGINARLIRCSVINLMYELVNNYSVRFPDKKLRETLLQENWFKMLYILRNYVSHVFRIGIELTWAKKHIPDTEIIWRDFKVIKDKRSDIILTDCHVFELLEELFNYLIKNRSKFD